MGGQSLVHYVRGDVLALGKIPQEAKHLVSHDTFFIVLGEAPDQLQQLLSLLLGSMNPAALNEGQDKVNHSNVVASEMA